MKSFCLTLLLLLPSFALSQGSQQPPTQVIYQWQGLDLLIKKDWSRAEGSWIKPELGYYPNYTLIVLRQGKSLDEITFKHVDAVGGRAEVSKYKSQLLPQFFWLAKFGDYDSRLLLVSAAGKILNLPFGDLYRDEHSLYSVREDDVETGEQVRLDLKTLKLETLPHQRPPGTPKLERWNWDKGQWVATPAAKG